MCPPRLCIGVEICLSIIVKEIHIHIRKLDCRFVILPDLSSGSKCRIFNLFLYLRSWWSSEFLMFYSLWLSIRYKCHYSRLARTGEALSFQKTRHWRMDMSDLKQQLSTKLIISTKTWRDTFTNFWPFYVTFKLCNVYKVSKYDVRNFRHQMPVSQSYFCWVEVQ